ncbi:50S ribosomal protein L4 [Candidatus Woesearchaeota archaeon]|nr:50S ribosomal protein L4 [Candidatus Woesearchaeota archaeon]
MKIKVFDKANTEKKSVDLPVQFNEPVRIDLVKRAVLSLQAARRQKYGAMPGAGQRYSSFLSKRRHKYKSTYGIGQSRTPRKVLNRRGTRFYYVGATAPQTVGGRRAHPPKAEKEWDQKINTREKRKAIRSALAASVDANLVKARGHHIPASYPLALDASFEELAKTKDVVAALQALGFTRELERANITSIRAGKGKARGRKTITKKSVLFVVSKDCPLLKAGANLPGTDVVPVNALNAELLAPGTHVGRVTLFTDIALDVLKEQQLFLDKKKGVVQ